MATTTIQLGTETREMLRAVGRKGQTYDEIIKELISVYEARLEELEQRLSAPDSQYVSLERLKVKWGIK
jgi:predicted DNA-binding protein